MVRIPAPFFVLRLVQRWLWKDPVSGGNVRTDHSFLGSDCYQPPGGLEYLCYSKSSRPPRSGRLLDEQVPIVDVYAAVEPHGMVEASYCHPWGTPGKTIGTDYRFEHELVRNVSK